MATYKKSIAASSLNPQLRVLIELLARVALEEILAQSSMSNIEQINGKAA